MRGGVGRSAHTGVTGALEILCSAFLLNLEFYVHLKIDSVACWLTHLVRKGERSCSIEYLTAGKMGVKVDWPTCGITIDGADGRFRLESVFSEANWTSWSA